MLHHYMELGGLLMWPLLGCSVFLGAVLLERFWVVGVRHLLLGGRVERSLLTGHRRILPFFMDVPPSLGLLGTVLGVVQSFHLLDGKIEGNGIATGLGVACMTTIFGLGIATVASIFQHALDWVVGEAEPDPGRNL